ncbi:MAG: tryptophan synthase subunit alpha [Deltaproteobacteria bacterium]
MTINSGRIEKTFAALKERGEKALIAFTTAGDPDMKTTVALVHTLEASGADIIELGIPFSDPMADGPTIQASSERALKNGVTIKDVFGAVAEIRKDSAIPIVLFGYYNPVFVFGVKRFAREAKRAGCDGVLIVDLPAEEAGDLKKELDARGLDLIFLLTPTSDASRIRLISGMASGFLYFISVTGVTGARAALSANIPAFVKKIKKASPLPVAVGFGISSPEQARAASHLSDGVIVGSALINKIAGKKRGKLLDDAGRFIASLKSGMTGR